MADIIKDTGIKLKEVGLNWNKITAIGGNAIANALETNNSLKILDLSWNIIGQRPSETKKVESNINEGDVGKAWGKALAMNIYLVHLDLSYNGIPLAETIELQEDIKENNTLIGFHYHGNKGPFENQTGKVDSLGFIELEDMHKHDVANTQFMPTLPDGTPRKTYKKLKPKIYEERVKSPLKKAEIKDEKLHGNQVVLRNFTKNLLDNAADELEKKQKLAKYRMNES